MRNQFALYRVNPLTSGKVLWHKTFEEVREMGIPVRIELFQIRELLSTLPQREQEVLRMRFGLDDGYALTLEEVGLYFDVTRERIRQIEAKALRRLRHPKRSRQLKDWN